MSPGYDPLFLAPGDIMDFEMNQKSIPFRNPGSIAASPSAASKNTATQPTLSVTSFVSTTISRTAQVAI
jgi:hypothetical protein